MQRRSLVLTGPRQLAWVEEQLPPVGPPDILVATRLGAISIGTEVPLYRGDSRGSSPIAYPRMTGYENVAVIRALGSGVRDLHVGDRVVAWYGHRTHAVLPAGKAIFVPPDISDEAALLTVLSGDVATGIHKLGQGIRGPVLVTGAGTIGLLAVFVLNQLAAEIVDVVEPVTERRALARLFGARRAAAPDDTVKLLREYAAGIECSSRDAAFALLQSRMCHHGQICVLADGNREPLILAPAFHERELTVCGSSDCPDYHAHARWYFPLASTHADTLDRIFNLEVTAAELPETFERLGTGELTPVKVLVRYDDS